MGGETSTATTRAQCGDTATVNCPVPGPNSITLELAPSPKRERSATSPSAAASILPSYRATCAGSRFSRPAIANSFGNQLAGLSVAICASRRMIASGGQLPRPIADDGCEPFRLRSVHRVSSVRQGDVVERLSGALYQLARASGLE